MSGVIGNTIFVCQVLIVASGCSVERCCDYEDSHSKHRTEEYMRSIAGYLDLIAKVEKEPPDDNNDLFGIIEEIYPNAKDAMWVTKIGRQYRVTDAWHREIIYTKSINGYIMISPGINGYYEGGGGDDIIFTRVIRQGDDK